jgi:ketosteroid isomerase-like protein
MQISKDHIIGLEYALIKAISTSDVEFLDRVLHDDLRFLAPNGQVITKAMDLASHRGGEMVVDEIIPTIEEIKIIDDTAIVVIVYDTKGKMLGNPIEGRFRYIRMWKQFSDGLKVIGGSCFKL